MVLKYSRRRCTAVRDGTRMRESARIETTTRIGLFLSGHKISAVALSAVAVAVEVARVSQYALLSSGFSAASHRNGICVDHPSLRH
jgi:hypothetical protein